MQCDGVNTLGDKIVGYLLRSLALVDKDHDALDIKFVLCFAAELVPRTALAGGQHEDVDHEVGRAHSLDEAPSVAGLVWAAAIALGYVIPLWPTPHRARLHDEHVAIFARQVDLAVRRNRRRGRSEPRS